MGQRAALYARVSTSDQCCDRQERDLRAFAERGGYEIVAVCRETGSGAKLDRVERRRVMALAQAREIDVVLVTGMATLDAAIIEAVEQWRFGPVVEALRCLRGVDTVIAATLVAEIGDISRFDRPRQLMAWLGLVPSERSSGATVRRGRITKAGNALARSMLIEASWSYRHPARDGRRHLQRAAHLPERIRDIGWKAQTRLCSRYRRLSGAGKPLPKVIAAVARELAGFVWSITREQPLRA